MNATKTIVLVIAAVGGTVPLGCSERNDLLDDTPPSKIASADAKAVHGIGYVEPISEVHSLSFKTGGIIDRCLVNVGDSCDKSAVLMVLDEAEQKKAVAVAKMELEVAKAKRADILSGINKFEIRAAQRAVEMWAERVDFARREVTRCRKLINDSAISQSECDAAETSLQQASAQLRRAEAELEHLKNFVTAEDKQLAEANAALAQRRLESADQQLANLRLTAPFDGTVLDILRREGEAVSTIFHEPAILYGDITRLRIRAEIDERYVHQISGGQTALISGRGLGYGTCKGHVALVKKIMGKKTVFSRAPSERKDLSVVQVLVDMEDGFSAPVGLRVDVEIEVHLDRESR